MPECHKCLLNGQRSPKCLSCKGPPDTNHKGASHISIDAGEDDRTLGETLASLATPRPVDDDSLADALDMARRVACEFCALSASEFALVQKLMQGGTMAGVGRNAKLTRATISARVKRLVARHPVFEFLRQGPCLPPVKGAEPMPAERFPAKFAPKRPGPPDDTPQTGPRLESRRRGIPARPPF